MEEILHIKIKEKYAASLLKHLESEKAIEIVQDTGNDIPEWQKLAVKKTLSDIEANASILQSWEEVKAKYGKQ